MLVVGGQTLCLLLTLLAVPVFYSMFEDLGEWLGRVRTGLRSRFRKAVAVTVTAGRLRVRPDAARNRGTPAQEVTVQPRVGVQAEKHMPLRRCRAGARERSGAARLADRCAKRRITASRRPGRLRPGGRDAGVSHERGVAGGLGARRHGSGKLTQTEWNAAPQVSGLLPPWGGSYSLTFNNSRQQSDNLFTSLNPQYPTGAQPGSHAAAVARAALRRTGTASRWRARTSSSPRSNSGSA